MAVLVTGGSEGIGLALARCFARDGHDLVLVARSGQRLAEARAALASSGRTVHVLVEDLADPAAPARLMLRVRELGVTIDVLVNNAGVGVYGEFVDTDLEAERGLIRLNIESLVALTKLVLPAMKARGSGGILNVGSTAGFQPGPLMAVYYASKAFVLSFSEALANELEGTGIQVSVLCPGPTLTRFQARAGIEGALFDQAMSAESVAEIGYRGFLRRRHVIIPGLPNRLLAFAVRFAPRAWPAAIVRRLQERRRR